MVRPGGEKGWACLGGKALGEKGGGVGRECVMVKV